MHHVKKFAVLLPLAVPLAFPWSFQALAQGAEAVPPAPAAGTSRTAGCCALGGFMGLTDRDDADFTVGAEFEYFLPAPWSAGAIVEHTPDGFRGGDITLVLGAAHYRPPALPGLKVTGGAGVEFKDIGGDNIRLRAGIGYEVIQGPITFTPRLSLDVGDGDESVVLGATFFFRF